MAFFNEFPHTRTYDSDLGWLIEHTKKLLDDDTMLQSWKAQHEAEYNQLKDIVEGLQNSLLEVIVPWDPSIAYQIYSIVEYLGSNYIAIQPVPVGVNITDTNYWTPANTVIMQINAIGNTVSALQINEYYTTPQEYGAAGDGVTDDTGALQAAFNDPKGYVYLPPGTYLVTSTLTLPSNIVIKGTPQSVIKTDPGFTGNYVIEIPGFRTHFQLESFSINCDDMAVGGIWIERPYNKCVISDVVIHNTTVTALYAGVDTSDISQTLVIDNCMFMASDVSISTDPLVIMNRVYELNLQNTKIMYRSARISSLPCLVLNYCWDSYIRGNSFAFTAACGVQFNVRSRYFTLIGNTYENVGYTTAYDSTPASGRMIELNTDSGQTTVHGFIIEAPYYNVGVEILLDKCQYIFILGDNTINEINGSSRNTLFDLNYGSNSGSSILQMNGNTMQLGQIINLALASDSQDYLSLRHTTGIPLEARVGSGGSETAILRYQNNNLFNLATNGALVLKDANGTNHYLRIDTGGNVVVSNS